MRTGLTPLYLVQGRVAASFQWCQREKLPAWVVSATLSCAATATAWYKSPARIGRIFVAKVQAGTVIWVEATHLGKLSGRCLRDDVLARPFPQPS